MKSLGIRVSLNGGAGDELLAGYIGHHLLPFLREMLENGQWSAAMNEVRLWRGTPYLNGVLARRFALHQMPGPLRRMYARRILALPEFSAFPLPPDGGDRIVGAAEKLGLGNLSTTLARNIGFTPIPMYVVQSDKLAMSIPMELRYPFLDHRMMDFAFQLPVSYLIRAGRSKAVLRDAARGLVPDEVINRREKMGFPVPLRQWMHEGMEYLRTQLGPEARSGRFVNAATVLADSGRFSEAVLWRIHQVELWMRVFDLH